MTHIENLKVDSPLLTRLKVLRKRGGPCKSYAEIRGILEQEGFIDPSTGRPWTKKNLQRFYLRETAGHVPGPTPRG